MIYINITNFVLISSLEKDHSMIETSRLKNVVIFFQTILSFVLSRKIIHYILELSKYTNNVYIGKYLVVTYIERLFSTVCYFFSYVCWPVNFIIFS